ncbi:MAG: DUF192 domain-containing protein [Spirochaetes bacterium]|nr:MAG: DUF192 domain-containing protein [Spirochaetota bacterium]
MDGRLITGSLISIVFLLFIGITLNCSTRRETVVLTVKGEKIVAEIARTPEERQKGLMYRKNLPENHGMLFVFDRDQKLSFWMKHTPLPLSIAFISKDGTIKEIYDMDPYSERIVESIYSVRYALEVMQGTFERLQIEVGDKITFPEGFKDG